MKNFVIRLRRSNTLRVTSYSLVVTFSDYQVRGKFFEKIGFYSPSSKTKFFFVNFKRLSFWLAKGALISPRAGFLVGKLPQGQPINPQTAK